MSGLRFLPGMSYTEIDEVALKLLDIALHDAIPPYCPVRIIGMLNMLTCPAHQVTTEHLTQKDRTFTLESRWLSLRRTRSQAQTVLTMRCTCSQNDADADMHAAGAKALSYEPERADRAAGDHLLYVCLGILFHAKKLHPGESTKLYRFSERQGWPYFTDQIFPHGAAETIRGYLDWTVTEDVATFQQVLDVLVGHFTYGMTLIVLPAVQNHLFLDQFMHAASHWTDYAIKLLQTPPAVTSKTKPESAAHSDEILDIFSHMSITMQIIVHACSDRTTATFFLQKRFSEVLIACDRMITTSALLAKRYHTENSIKTSEDIQDSLILVGSIIYNHFPGSRASTSQLSSHGIWMRSAHRLDVPHIIMWASFLDTVVYQYVRQRCSAPGCIRTPEEHRHTFGYCKGCLRISYCTRACQKKAWRRDDELQHRNVCALIRHICTRYQIPRTRKPRMGSPYVPALTDQDVRIVGVINTHFTALTRHELQS